MTRLLIAACAAVLSLAACNQAAPTPGGDADAPAEGPRGPRQDANGDGKVTLDEAKAGQKRLLERADANRDGKVGLEELEALPERMADRLDRMDADDDREITRAEIEAAAVERFNRRDANKDGVLTGDEMRMPRRGDRAGSPDLHGSPVG